MDIRNILCLQEAQYEPTEAYYRRFEASISTSELAKCMVMTHVEPKKTYAGEDDDNITKRFQAMCLLLPADYEQYSGNWDELENSTLLGMENDPKTPTAAYDVLCHYKKPAPQR